jgi:hypothetical protein
MHVCASEPSGELSAASRKLELLASDLAAEHDRVAATAAVLERKRGKKRRWKEAYSASASEVAALHTQLLLQHKELEGLEGHLRQLHTELRLLGVVAGTSSAGGEAAGRRPRSGVAGVLRVGCCWYWGQGRD